MPNYFIMEMQMMDNKTLVLGKLTESKIRGLIHPAVQLSSQPFQEVSNLCLIRGPPWIQG